jgi:hypothetical protein
MCFVSHPQLFLKAVPLDAMLLLGIREVPGLNLGTETGYPDFIRIFVDFLSPSRLIQVEYLTIRPRPLPSKSFPINRSLITLSFDAEDLIW